MRDIIKSVDYNPYRNWVLTVLEDAADVITENSAIVSAIVLLGDSDVVARDLGGVRECCA